MEWFSDSHTKKVTCFVSEWISILNESIEQMMQLLRYIQLVATYWYNNTVYRKAQQTH